MRSLILLLGTAAAVVLLGNALAAHNWLLALPLACFVSAGLVLLVPRASAQPVPASATEDSALATGEGL
jgi:hypothetical protein